MATKRVKRAVPPEIAEKRAEIKRKRLEIMQKRAKSHKRCGKCGEIKEISAFGTHNDTADGHQTYCKACKNKLGEQRRARNTVARMRHHFATRIATQLGDAVPPNLVRDLHLYLGYSFVKLKEHLRSDLKNREGEDRKLVDALEEGYHIDHITPLSWFKVVKDNGDCYTCSGKPEEGCDSWLTTLRIGKTQRSTG